MKRKRRLYNIIVTIVFLTVLTVAFLDWNKKNKTHSRFSDIEMSIYQEIPSKQNERAELIYPYCDTLNQFIIDNPIDIKNELNCMDYKLQDSIKIDSYKTDFFVKVQNIATYYRRQERVASLRMFIIIIISQVLVLILRKLIDKTFKD